MKPLTVGLLAAVTILVTRPAIGDAEDKAAAPPGPWTTMLVKGTKMALPRMRAARSLYQSARQRFEDAEFLLEAERTTGAIYLAGYSIECMLKVLILSAVAPGKRSEALTMFRGARAHDYDWLKARYFENGGPPFPSAVSKSFSLVDTWTTELRYKSGTSTRGEAEAFLKAAKQIMDWADGRL